MYNALSSLKLVGAQRAQNFDMGYVMPSMFAKLREDEIPATETERTAVMEQTARDQTGNGGYTEAFIAEFPDLVIETLMQAYLKGKRPNKGKAQLQRDRMIHALRTVYGD